MGSGQDLSMKSFVDAGRCDTDAEPECKRRATRDGLMQDREETQDDEGWWLTG